METTSYLTLEKQPPTISTHRKHCSLRQGSLGLTQCPEIPSYTAQRKAPLSTAGEFGSSHSALSFPARLHRGRSLKIILCPIHKIKKRRGLAFLWSLWLLLCLLQLSRATEKPVLRRHCGIQGAERQGCVWGPSRGRYSWVDRRGHFQRPILSDKKWSGRGKARGKKGGLDGCFSCLRKTCSKPCLFN